MQPTDGTGDRSSLSPSALEGVRIIEAATLGAAPWVSTFLSEYGAEVIKVEPPGKGDPLRTWGHLKDGVGLLWKTVGRNKRSITLDLHHETGQSLFKQLVRTADILIVNFRPGRLERWGLGYDVLSQEHPGLIMLHISAFGQTGPYAQRPGFGTLVEAMSGFAHITGEPDGPPTLPSFPLADAVAAQAGAAACLAALYHRDLGDGRGQLIDVALLEPLTRFLEHMVLEYDQLGLVQGRTGNKWKITVPRNAYVTADGRWVAMSGSSPRIAERAIRAIGREDWLDDPVMRDPQGRLEHADEIDDAVAEWIAARPFAEVMAVFEEHEVAAAPIYSVDQLVEDPHVRARGMFQRVPDDELGEVLVQGPVARLSATPGQVRHLGRPLGADTAAVLAEACGIDEQGLRRLRDDGVV